MGLASGVGQTTAAGYIVDLGFAGERWAAHWQADYGTAGLPQAADDGQAMEAGLDRWLHGLRQVVKQVLLASCRTGLSRTTAYQA